MLIKIIIEQFGVCVILLLCLLCGNAWAIGETTRVSVRSDGVQAESDVYSPSLSANGRFVVFASTSRNLVVSDSNGFSSDVFVHDRLTHQTTLVSVDSAGIQGNSDSSWPDISADGRFVAFISSATNLVAGDTNGEPDVFVHDRLTHKTTRVSVSSNGMQGNLFSDSPSISADGRWISFRSWNLVSGDTGGFPDAFVHDRLTHKTERVRVDSAGRRGNNVSYNSDISADGRFVAFGSFASNLVAGDTNGAWEIFVHDRLTHKTERIGISSNGMQGNDHSFYPNLSANGRWVVFGSSASNLVAGDTNSTSDVFVHYRLTHKTERISVDSGGVQGDSYSGYTYSQSADGRFIAFDSGSSNLVAGDTNNTEDVFVHDRLTHKTTRVSLNSQGVQGKGISLNPNLSANGRLVVFESESSNLVVGDTNTVNDIFIRDRTIEKRYQDDLQIATTQQPATLAKGSQGSYSYTITNNGPDLIYHVRITHLVSNGKVIGFTPSQGTCRRYASISLCDLKQLDPGGTLTLTVDVKAVRNAVHQQVSVASQAKADPQMTNNSVTVDTPVTP